MQLPATQRNTELKSLDFAIRHDIETLMISMNFWQTMPKTA